MNEKVSDIIIVSRIDFEYQAFSGILNVFTKGGAMKKVAKKVKKTKKAAKKAK